MTTLTERLRELEAEINNNYSDDGNYNEAKDALEGFNLAQELHALLVECGEALAMSRIVIARETSTTYSRVDELLTKLKQAGIV